LEQVFLHQSQIREFYIISCQDAIRNQLFINLTIIAFTIALEQPNVVLRMIRKNVISYSRHISF